MTTTTSASATGRSRLAFARLQAIETEEQRAPRHCPVCGGEESKSLFRQSFAQLSGARLLDGYEVVICADCGVGFADDIPEQHVFDEYYAELSKYDYADRGGVAPPDAERRFQDIVAILQDFIPSSDASILEIGSASGQLLKILRDRGYANVLGADPSPGCIRAAQELYGIPGIAGTVFDLHRPDPLYDFVILIGVMEHIRDVGRAVANLRRILADGGRVYLEVPDASRYSPQFDAPFQEFSVEHINFFSRLSLINLMRTHGFHAVASGEALRPQHEARCPGAWGVFEQRWDPEPIESDATTEAGLRTYVSGCTMEDTRIRGVIASSVKPGDRMIVWGTGAHTLRLLASGGLDPVKIALFVDSSPKSQGRELCGLPVVSPAELLNRHEPILISSCGFQNEIRRQIQNELKLTNPLVLLYGVDAAGIPEAELG